MYRYPMRSRKTGPETALCWVVMLVLVLLLCLRDIGAVAVNKYIFVVLLAPLLLFLKAPHVFFLWAFMMPLYVGLPGNFLTLVMFLRLVLDAANQKSGGLRKGQFIRTLCFAAFMLVQNVALGYTRTFHMMFVLEIILVYFIMSADFEGELPSVVLYYSCGVATLGVIMLAATLRQVPFSSLLSAATRLGDIDLSEGMTVIIDPNFYGLFAVAAIACNWCMIANKRYTKHQKTAAILVSVIALLIGIIGLSRAFAVSLVVWFLLAVLNEKTFRTKVGLFFAVLVLAAAAIYLLPESVDALLARFKGADMVTGNGRIAKMAYAVERWASTPWTVLFGYGLFQCVVHFMQMQYFAGCGLVGFFLVVSWYYSFWKARCPQTGKINRSGMVPVLVVQFAAALVPTATSMTFMMPVVMSILAFGEVNRREEAAEPAV